MILFRKVCLGLFALALLLTLAGLAMHNAALARAAGALAAIALPIGLGAVPALRGYQFTAWIIAAVAVPLIYPAAFGIWNISDSVSINIKNKWVVLIIIQLVMFGMGTQMSIRDFAGVAKMPHGVIVGLICQFTIMPIVGFTLAKIFGFPGEIAAGLVLIGACSSGLASNVMAHIGKLNLPLSITLTACATAIAPFITPFWMSTLGAKFDASITYIDTMMDIIKLVVAPIGAAMLHDFLKRSNRTGWLVVSILSVMAFVWLVILGKHTALFPAKPLTAEAVIMAAISFVLGAVLVGQLYHLLTLKLRKLDSFMPVFSMFGIIYFTAIATASGRNELLTVGLALFIAAVLHNTLGYVLGYSLSRLMRLSRGDARTVAMEVGLQNGGMAFGIAQSAGKLATLGLAAAIFSPWMNISGSILANYWKKHPAKDDPPTK